jgi:hypothetical protein
MLPHVVSHFTDFITGVASGGPHNVWLNSWKFDKQKPPWRPGASRLDGRHDVLIVVQWLTHAHKHHLAWALWMPKTSPSWDVGRSFGLFKPNMWISRTILFTWNWFISINRKLFIYKVYFLAMYIYIICIPLSFPFQFHHSVTSLPGPNTPLGSRHSELGLLFLGQRASVVPHFLSKIKLQRKPTNIQSFVILVNSDSFS